MTTFLIVLGIIILAGVALLILAGWVGKFLSGLDPRDWEE